MTLDTKYLRKLLGGLETTIPQFVERIEWGVRNLPKETP